MSLAVENIINTQKISAGVVIRKITSYLYSELMRIIKELAPQTNIENKRNTIQTLIREFHKIIKKLHKFVKNLKNFENLNQIDQLSTYIYHYKERIRGVMDQLYYTHEMSTFLRTPSFNLTQSVNVINNNQHVNLKRNIANALYNNILQEKKERIFYLTEKFFYNENLIEKEKTHTLEKMKKDCAYVLNLNCNLSKLQNVEMNETAYYKDGRIIFKLGEITFKIVFFNYQKDEVEYLSYYCVELTLSKNQKYFIKTNETIMNYMNYLNTEILYKNIQIVIPKNSSQEKNFKFDLKFLELQTYLRNFVQKYVNRELFKQIKLSLKNYIDKKFHFTTEIKSLGKNKNEISIVLKYEIYTEEFYLKLRLSGSNGEISEGFYLDASHVIVNESPLIFAHRHSCFYNFNQIGKINFEKLICDKIKEFEKIHLYFIYEKCKTIKSLFFPIKIELNECNAKINFFYTYTTSQEKFLLFSLFNDMKGNLQIVDEKFLLPSDSNQQLRKNILNCLNNESMNVVQFNEILFENFFFSFFNLNGIHVCYENFNPCNNKVTLKFLIHENKSVNRKCFLFIELNVLRNTKFLFDEISLNICEKSLNEELIIHKLNLRDDLFYEILNTRKTKTEKFDGNFFTRIITLIKFVENRFEEFFVNLTGVLNFSTNYEIINDQKSNLSINKLTEGDFYTPVIKIPVSENYSQLADYLDKENQPILQFYIKEFLIFNKNLIIKIFLNEENLNTKFPTVLHNFSIFDTDNIIYFNSKEKSINLYFLTKMNVKNTIDFNYFKRFFTKILNKLLMFIRKISNLLNNEEMKEILSHSENILISPIGLQFKYNFFEHSNKTILIHFVNYINSDKKNLKCLILPLEYHHHSLFSFDLLLKMIHECDETTILSNLKFFIFLSAVYNKVSTRFSTYIFPLSKNTYDLINRPNKIFVFLKDYKTFHIIVQNKFSIFIEIISVNKILIYSSYLWNSENCIRFIDSIVNNQEIVKKSNSATDAYGNSQSGKKLIVLSNDPICLLNDINKILNYIDKFE